MSNNFPFGSRFALHACQVHTKKIIFEVSPLNFNNVCSYFRSGNRMLVLAPKKGGYIYLHEPFPQAVARPWELGKKAFEGLFDTKPDYLVPRWLEVALHVRYPTAVMATVMTDTIERIQTATFK